MQECWIGCIIIGGEDGAVTDPDARDALIGLNTKRLVSKAPEMSGIDIAPAYAWAGTFAETADGLPPIGSLERWPGVFFALGCGGNGITFSLLAAQFIRDAILGRTNDDAAIFSFDRLMQRQGR